MKTILESILGNTDYRQKRNALLITLPSTIKWEDYEKELKVVEDESQVMNFNVPFLPKNTNNIKRVYLVYKGNIVGWQKFVGTSDKPFKCTTTDKNWEGKGFQGFRYFGFEE